MSYKSASSDFFRKKSLYNVHTRPSNMSGKRDLDPPRKFQKNLRPKNHIIYKVPNLGKGKMFAQLSFWKKIMNLVESENVAKNNFCNIEYFIFLKQF